MRSFNLLDEQILAWGATHAIEVTYADLTTAGAAQTLTTDITLLAQKQGLQVIAGIVVTPFVSSDGTLISTTFTVGDGGSAARQLASQETNAAATVVYNKAGALTAPYVPSSDTPITITAGCTVAKLLSSHTAGKILFLCVKTDQTLIS
jgi:hypothetical protein